MPSPPASLAKDSAPSATPALALARAYQRLMLLGTVGFLLVVGLTVYSGWQRHVAAEVGLIHQQLHGSAIRLQAIIKSASDQITQLADWSNRFPRHAPYQGAADVRQAVEQARKAGDITLDALQALPPEQRLGQMVALTAASQPRAGGLPSDLDVALALVDRLGVDAKTSPFLRWTYFNAASQNLLLIAPWVASKDLLGDEPDSRSFLQHSWRYEVTTAGLPANNPQRQPYWTRAYQDQAGAGLMISHAAPIYWGDDFVGVVATDVLLGFLSDFLREFPDQEGLLTISNEQGQILGDRRDMPAGQAEITSIDTLLPPKLLNGVALDNLRGESIGSDLVFSASTDNPHWRIVFQVPQATIHQRALAAFSAQLYLSLFMVLGVFVVNLLLWRMYVAPALQIADFVARESGGGHPVLPRVPRLWQPWLDAMAQAFGDRQRYLNELQQSNEALEQRVARRTQALQAANTRLEALSVTDPLTGAFNRRHLFELLISESQRVLRGGEVFSLLMIDLDFFKKVNNGFGHLAGDAVLCEFVARSRAAVRKTDVVCRFGGEEFVVFMPAMRGAGAAQLGERLRHAIDATPVVFDGAVITVTVSVGVASYRAGESLEELLSRADHRLYMAKEEGRNRVVCEA
ncbi:diguanylate cyclase [Rhodoferax sp. 4810]|nr:diguanylate cyclase [Rhodoferax jenense]